MNKLKIAYLVPRFHPFRGGGEQNIFALASRMAKEGHDVTVITARVKYRNEELPYTEEYEGMHIVRNWALNEWLYLGFYPGLLIYLLNNKFDVIHSSGIGFLWREICLMIKKVFSPKTKFITTPHGPFMAATDETDTAFRRFSKSTYTSILKIFMNWLYDSTIAITPKQNEWLIKDYNISSEKIILIPNGLDKKYLEKELHEHKKDEKVIITYMNRHEWYKGIQDMVKAVDSLRRSDALRKSKSEDYVPLPEFEFWIMGRAGNYTPSINELIEKLKVGEYTKFIFSPTDEERDRIFYEESQINVLPSRWEATGIALMEAMAKGNVGITTYQNEAWDIIIKEGENGFVFNFGDVEALTEILRKLLSDYKLRQTMRKNSLEFMKNFTWEAVFEDYKELVNKLTTK